MEASCTFTPEVQEGITFFRVFDKDNVVVVDNIPAADRTVTFEVENVCNGWHFAAVLVYGDREILTNRISSDVWCPKDPVVPAACTFSITGTMVIKSVSE